MNNEDFICIDVMWSDSEEYAKITDDMRFEVIGKYHKLFPTCGFRHISFYGKCMRVHAGIHEQNELFKLLQLLPMPSTIEFEDE